MLAGLVSTIVPSSLPLSKLLPSCSWLPLLSMFFFLLILYCLSASMLASSCLEGAKPWMLKARFFRLRSRSSTRTVMSAWWWKTWGVCARSEGTSVCVGEGNEWGEGEG